MLVNQWSEYKSNLKTLEVWEMLLGFSIRCRTLHSVPCLSDWVTAMRFLWDYSLRQLGTDASLSCNWFYIKRSSMSGVHSMDAPGSPLPSMIFLGGIQDI